MRMSTLWLRKFWRSVRDMFDDTPRGEYRKALWTNSLKRVKEAKSAG